MEQLTGGALLANDKTFEGDSLEDKVGRALHSGYQGEDAVKDFFVNLMKASMDSIGVDIATQKQALPETDFATFEKN